MRAARTLVAFLFVVACSGRSTVDQDDDANSSNSSSSSSSSSSTAGSSSATSSSTGSSMTPAKDAVARRSGTSLFIVAGNYMPTCTNNEHPQQCGYWRIEIELRQEAQQPGTYELANWGFGSASSIIDEWLGTPGDTDCGFGGGVGGGTIELIELDASHVVFDLSGVLIFADGANGPHEASMCP